MVTENMIVYVAILIFVIAGIFLFIYLLDNITGGHIIRGLVCGMLYTIPLGSLNNMLIQGCASIPA